MKKKKKELNRIEERLKELSKYELFLDNIFIKDRTARQIIISAYNKLERQQKEIEELKKPKYMINLETGTITTIDSNFIIKDKIREKRQEIMSYAYTSEEEKRCQDYACDRLQELL